jgi:predicted enzyme related to lactoylglutathione lyase
MGGISANLRNRPAWVDLSTKDPAGARDFYGKLFGWEWFINPDPQYGGYAIARIDGTDVAGIGGLQMPEAPTAWMVYMGTDDAAGLEQKVQANGGTVIAPTFDIGDQGRMAVFQDPAGAFVSAWEPAGMGSFLSDQTNTFVWAELNSRDLPKAAAFYDGTFGWTHADMGPGGYQMFQLGGATVAGATPMNAMAPAEMPSYWAIYFGVDNVDEAVERAKSAGGQAMMGPMDYPGGRFAMLGDPQGGIFLVRSTSSQG